MFADYNRLINDVRNWQLWIWMNEEDRAANSVTIEGNNMTKECPLYGYVDADWQDCDKCGRCVESKK